MTRVRQFSRSEFSGHRGLERAWEMTERLEIYLSGCQVGITISSVTLGVVAEPAVAAVFTAAAESLGLGGAGSGAAHATVAVIAALAVINVLHVIVGEQTPTYFGVERTKTAAKYGAPVLYWWTKLMAPVIFLADKTAKWILGLFGITISRSWTEDEEMELPSSRGELRREMGEALANVGLSDERQEEVLNAFRIGEQPVREVMVPTEEIVALSTAIEPEENLSRMADHPHTRYPLVGEELTDFRGIVYVPVLTDRREALAAGDLDFEAVAAPPMTLSPEVDVSDAIDQFQAEAQELALVIEDGEVVGMVTVTDLLESITGDIEDPIDVDALDAGNV